MRALRLLHGDLPDLSVAGRRARWPPRPHLPHQGDARGRRAFPFHSAAPRQMSDLPRMRDDLSIGGSLRAPAGYWPASHRAGSASDVTGAVIQAGFADRRSASEAVRRASWDGEGVTRVAAEGAAASSAGRASVGGVASRAASTTHVGAGGLCATSRRSRDQRRRCPRFGSAGHLVGCGGRWMLWCPRAPLVRGG